MTRESAISLIHLSFKWPRIRRWGCLTEQLEGGFIFGLEASLCEDLLHDVGLLDGVALLAEFDDLVDGRTDLHLVDLRIVFLH